VTRVGARADEVVVRDPQCRLKLREAPGVPLDELGDAHACRLGGEHVLDRVLVRAGEEPDGVAPRAQAACDDVGLDELERVAEMRRPVDVRDRRRHVDTSAHSGTSFGPDGAAPDERPAPPRGPPSTKGV